MNVTTGKTFLDVDVVVLGDGYIYCDARPVNVAEVNSAFDVKLSKTAEMYEKTEDEKRECAYTNR